MAGVHHHLGNAQRARASGGSGEGAAPPELETQFVVRESGRIRFLAQLGSLGLVRALAFTLAPCGRSVGRRVVVADHRFPDTRVAERRSAVVDRVGDVDELSALAVPPSDVGLASVIELARGTYAIAAHRDHAHLLYELDFEARDDLRAFLSELHIEPRGSLLAVVAPAGPAPRGVGPFDPALLDREGVQLVLGGAPPQAPAHA